MFSKIFAWNLKHDIFYLILHIGSGQYKGFTVVKNRSILCGPRVDDSILFKIYLLQIWEKQIWIIKRNY